ncbi:MAG TPA: ATP-binding protein [Burkholderiales bacterium]|nr:ATP-binding protein [Burkholderiales bacterium]
MASSGVDSATDLSIGANTDELRRASSWLGEFARQHDIPSEQIWRLDLCLNEALANIIAYGGAGASSSAIHLHLGVRRGPHQAEAVITVVDAGAAFNPLSAVQKQKPATLADAEPGGLGLPMLHAFSDSLNYRYSDGHNRLTFGVSWTEARQ